MNGNSKKDRKKRKKRETKDLSGGGHMGLFSMCAYLIHSHTPATHNLMHREEKGERREEERRRVRERIERKREFGEFTSS